MAQTVPPDSFDYCCRPPRSAYDFDDENPGRLSNADVLRLLKYNQGGIISVLIVLLLLVITIQVFSVVPGFAKFDGAAGEVSAVSHIGWWMAIETVVLVIGAMSIYFGLHYTKQGTVEKGVGRVRDFLTFYIFVLVVAILANIVHLVLAGIELTNCTSTLCTSQHGFLVALIVLLIFIALLECWQIYRVHTYGKNLFYTLANGMGSWEMKEPELQMPVQFAMNNNNINARPSPVTMNALSNVRAPLLQQVIVDHKSKKNTGVHALKDRSD